MKQICKNVLLFPHAKGTGIESDHIRADLKSILQYTDFTYD